MPEDDFRRDLDKLKNLSARDRDILVSAFERHARRLVEDAVTPRLEESFKSAATHNALRDAAINALTAADMPRRLERVEDKVDSVVGKVEKLDGQMRGITTDVRELRRNARADFRLLFSALITTSVGLAAMMAKGFGWL